MARRTKSGNSELSSIVVYTFLLHTLNATHSFGAHNLVGGRFEFKHCADHLAPLHLCGNLKVVYSNVHNCADDKKKLVSETP